MNVLAGDIGGTKTILAVYSSDAGLSQPLAEISFPSGRYTSLEYMIREFLATVEMPVDTACFAVAGPVLAQRAKITNLTWVIDGPTIKSTFDWKAVAVLNDMQGIANAIPSLQPEDIFTLNEGTALPEGNIGVLAPGTGLGEGFLTWAEGRYHPYGCEGSHVSFGPVGELQIGLLQYMNKKGFDHVSVERVCSGGLGIPNLYSYLKSIGYPEPDWLAEQLAAAADPTPVILAAAQDPTKQCDLACAVIDLFVAILGGEAGNLALKVLATGGLYLSGGMSPRIVEQLQKPAFLEAMHSKGRFREMLSNVPVRVILNPKVGLLGAAAYGMALAG